jgi:DNA-binding MarR family transcriptional regulator
METQARELVVLAARFARHTWREAPAVPPELAEPLAAAGLGLRHLHAMIPLAVDGPMIVGRLADRLALAAATTSQLVNELRRAGLVLRSQDETDRRRAVISIRDDLRPAVARLAESRLRPFRETLARLPEPARTHFLHGWRLLVEAHENAELTATGEGNPR